MSIAHIKVYFPTTQDRKTIKKTAKSFSPLTADHSRRFLSAAATQGISAFNFRWFQQPIRSCGIVLTANQRCGQNLAAVSSSLWDLVSSPILAILDYVYKRECMRTAKFGPDLRLPWNAKHWSCKPPYEMSHFCLTFEDFCLGLTSSLDHMTRNALAVPNNEA